MTRTVQVSNAETGARVLSIRFIQSTKADPRFVRMVERNIQEWKELGYRVDVESSEEAEA